MKTARTSAEAHLYMDLHPCSCGEIAFDRRSKVIERDDELASIYEGWCEGCGARRRFEFLLPSSPPAVGPRLVFGGDEPSDLVDPGEFLDVADEHASRAPRSLEGLAGPERQSAREELEVVVAALEEVLKFIPDGAARVPREAFRTHRGRQVYEREPDRFDRGRLEATLDVYRQLIG